MNYILEIFKDGEKVNTITSNTDQQARNELLKVFYSKEFYNTKTRISKNYNTLIITQTFAHSFGTYKYLYTFEEVDL